jgi:hypothetical protein
MSREKQIEEMAQIIRNRLPHIGRTCVEGECVNGDKNSVHENPCWCVYKEIAEMIYNEGYRKQSEGEWEKFEGERFICSNCAKVFGLGSTATIHDVKRVWNYCPNCGAKMKGG